MTTPKPNDIIPSKLPCTLRVVSINVNGLRASHKKGLFDWIATSDADVICMQETRLTHEQWDDKFKPQGWHYHLFAAIRLG